MITDQEIQQEANERFDVSGGAFSLADFEAGVKWALAKLLVDKAHKELLSDIYELDRI